MSIELVMPSNCLILCPFYGLLMASGGDGIPAELFQILKDDAFKVLYSICQQIWETQRQYFANKRPSSQGYDFSSNHVRM